MQSIYETGDYLQATGDTWHLEDSAWKASQILRIMQANQLCPKSIAEVGCGAGGILERLAQYDYLGDADFEGFDVSPLAIKMCKPDLSRVTFSLGDIFEQATGRSAKYDCLLAIDVFEHVPKYWDFLERCCSIAEYKIYHIPLDIHVSSVLRASFIDNRYTIGHLHYFSAESALAVLRDTGHEVLDFFYTSGGIGLYRNRPSVKRYLANVPRRCISWCSQRWAARLLGGYSLMVLTK